jgi:hypothetical protein
MYSFEEIVANALTSREEVEMVSNAQIGAEQDIDAEAAHIPVYVDVLLQHARYQAFLINRNPGTNPFGLR